LEVEMCRTILRVGLRGLGFLCLWLWIVPPATAQPRAYVSGELDDTGCSDSTTRCTRGLISVVNTDTRAIEGTVDLWRSSKLSVRNLIVSPAGDRLYAIVDAPGSPGAVLTSPGFTSVTVFATMTLTQLTSFTIEAHVSECALSRDGARLFCARNVLASDVVVIDTATHAVSATIPATYPTSIALSPDGRRLYVQHSDNRVTVHDGATYGLLATIPVSAAGKALAMTSDASHLYGASGCSAIVDIDATTNTVAGVIADVALGSECVTDIAFARGRAYVTVSGGMGFYEGLTVIDVASRTIVQRIDRAELPRAIAASYDESRVFVTRYPALDIFDAVTGELAGSVALPDGPGALALSPQPAGALLSIDVPASGQTVQQPFALGGWAVDIFGFGDGPGIDAIHVWAFPADGSSPVFVGAPAYGGPRADVAALYGPSYQNSGYGMTVSGLPPGTYRFDVFGHSSRTGTFAVAREITLTVVPSVAIMIDLPAPAATVPPSFVVAGWALDKAAAAGSGVDAVHVWAYPTSGTPPVFAGAATLDQPRPDVAAAFGSQFATAGYVLNVQNLPSGSYVLVAYAHQSITGRFVAQRTVTVTVTAPQPFINIDLPAAGATVGGASVRVAGWALELGAAMGTGVDAVHVWAYPDSGGVPLFIGAATYGLTRTDVGAAFGSAYTPCGFDVTGSLPPGSYTVVAFAHSTTTNSFNGVRSVHVTVQ
jgi:YVTN family beta-propeller protein